MKNQVRILLVGLVLGLISCEKSGPLDLDQANLSASLAAIQQKVSSLPLENIEESEKERILFIQEEEKLAYDVYNTMFDKYRVNISKTFSLVN